MSIPPAFGCKITLVGMLIRCKFEWQLIAFWASARVCVCVRACVCVCVHTPNLCSEVTKRLDPVQDAAPFLPGYPVQQLDLCVRRRNLHIYVLLYVSMGCI